MVASLAVFSSKIVCIRIRTILLNLDQGRYTHAQKVLDDTIENIEALPHNYDDIHKERLLQYLYMANMLMSLEIWQEAQNELKKGRSVFGDFLRNGKMVRKMFLSNKEDNIGSMTCLPFDLREFIYKKIVV
jgi:hypothetical protein